MVTFVGVLSLGSVGALAWTSSLLSRATQVVGRDMQSAALASELEVDLLAYQRISNMLLRTGEPALDEMRVEIERDIDERFRAARQYSAGAEEAALLDEVGRALRLYLRERARLEAAGRSIDEIIAGTREPLDAAVARLEMLREANAREVQRAHAEVARVDAVSNLAAAVVGALLVAGLVALALGVRRSILLPVLALHRTITDFRRGNLDARAREHGPRELVNLARAFNEMRDALDAQRKNQLAFLAGIAHDLRSPISALTMATSLLGEDSSRDEREQTRAVLERQLARLGKMVDDLLDANRIEAGELELDLRDVDLRSVAREAVDLYAPTSAAHEIVLEAPGEPVWTRGDPLRIEQVIGNLVSNAIKYSPDGGRIEVTVGQTDSDAHVAVSDRGIGIAPEDIEGIFAPFRRRAKRTAHGAGLGLSIVRRIVEAHGGAVDVQSSPGRGSRFTVRLPLRASQRDVQEPKEPRGRAQPAW